MEVTAKINYLRIAPRKVRLVADLIRGKSIEKARSLLDFSLKKGAVPLRKLLNDSVTNAKNNFQLDEETLVLSEIKVDEGPKLKRWRARARGRAAEIQKKSCHVTIILKGNKKKRVEEPTLDKISKVKKKNQLRQLADEGRKPTDKQKIPRLEKKKISEKKKEKISLKRIFKRKSF